MILPEDLINSNNKHTIVGKVGKYLRSKYILVAFAMNMSALFPIQAGEYYVGLKNWTTDWQSGYGEAYTRESLNVNLRAGFMAGFMWLADSEAIPPVSILRYQSDSVESAKMNLPGFSVSYIDTDWSLSYAGTAGTGSINYRSSYYYRQSGPDYAYFSQPYEASITTLPHDDRISVKRDDHEWIYVRRTKYESLSWYAGLKLQSYTVSWPHRFTFGVAEQTSFRTGLTDYYDFLAFTLANEQSFSFRGPAAGIRYSRTLGARHSLSASAGLLYFDGNYAAHRFYVETQELSSLYLIFSNSGRINSYGTSLDLTYSHLIGSGSNIFQLSLRRQDLRYGSSGGDSAVFGVYVDEEYGVLTPVPFFGLSTGFFNGARDVFSGISIAFHMRLDTSPAGND